MKKKKNQKENQETFTKNKRQFQKDTQINVISPEQIKKRTLRCIDNNYHNNQRIFGNFKNDIQNIKEDLQKLIRKEILFDNTNRVPSINRSISSTRTQPNKKTLNYQTPKHHMRHKSGNENQTNEHTKSFYSHHCTDGVKQINSETSHIQTVEIAQVQQKLNNKFQQIEAKIIPVKVSIKKSINQRDSIEKRLNTSPNQILLQNGTGKQQVIQQRCCTNCQNLQEQNQKLKKQRQIVEQRVLKLLVVNQQLNKRGKQMQQDLISSTKQLIKVKSQLNQNTIKYKQLYESHHMMSIFISLKNKINQQKQTIILYETEKQNLLIQRTKLISQISIRTQQLQQRNKQIQNLKIQITEKRQIIDIKMKEFNKLKQIIIDEQNKRKNIEKQMENLSKTLKEMKRKSLINKLDSERKKEAQHQTQIQIQPNP